MFPRRWRKTTAAPTTSVPDPTTAVRNNDVRLVPDEQAWGQGYATTAGYTATELDEIAANMPTDKVLRHHAARLATSTPGYHRIDATRCAIPPGYDLRGPGGSPLRPHDLRSVVMGLPATMDADITTSGLSRHQVPDHLRSLFRARGWVTDQHGRPSHPYYEQLLADDRVGLHAGIGFGSYWGEKTLVDAVVLDHDDHVLLVPHYADPDVAGLALPRGPAMPADEGRTTAEWRDGDRPVTTDGILAAARRRVYATTGVRVPADADLRIVRAARPVWWPHTTVHFWIAVYTVAIWLPAGAAAPVARYSEATWHHARDLDATLEYLWPDDQRAVLRAHAARPR